MKKNFIIFFLLMVVVSAHAQIDPDLLRRVPVKNDTLPMNMDAIYARPFLQIGKLPVVIGGYAEANYQYAGEDGVSEGHQFQMRRVALFLSSTISHRIKFLTEIEFEDGTKEINLEFASVDFEFDPLFNLRGGVVVNPIGSFNQNHDGPKWEFVDRPMTATKLLPATWSNVGFGVYGKKYSGNWVYGYEAYLTNGFDDRIIANTENKTFLPASKENKERFEESFNGSPLITTKFALRNRKVGELGISYMGGVYNKWEEDGITLDKKRRVDVFALDFNTNIPGINTWLNSEWAWIHVNLPPGYTQQFGNKQHGGFLDLVKPVIRKRIFGFENATINASLRLEYADWNVGKFIQTGGKIYDEAWAITPSLSFRPTAQTVIRFNYRHQEQKDILGNPPSKSAALQFGIATYF
jgi:hypothetical protein